MDAVGDTPTVVHNAVAISERNRSVGNNWEDTRVVEMRLNHNLMMVNIACGLNRIFGGMRFCKTEKSRFIIAGLGFALDPVFEAALNVLEVVAWVESSKFFACCIGKIGLWGFDRGMRWYGLRGWCASFGGIVACEV